ncbi:hypothetical protein KYD87_04385 [Escherichia fergusonii]|uniref:hypothetical protein n=1 Tax=Escherichia fergusonii TaxID=564 RepID=UPI001CC02C6D|nr:hypothetical protein [Escherichia fergusonii]UAT36076.1 hypothetical protein KYD87_04385 [Escherichia fergusonii]
MKAIQITLILLLCSTITACFASDSEGKYVQGDCITANDSSYTWFGEVAKVEAYTYITGFSGPKYILYFPYYKADSVVFEPEIENHTIKVPSRYCQNINNALSR